ncbi:MAG: hypothetical protein ACSHWS_13550 [Sulfitobacter sp.]
MSKILLTLGLAMTIGSGGVMYDFSAQSAKNPGEITSLTHYAQNLQSRVVNLMERDPGPRIASLPQISRPMATTTASFSSPPRSTEQDIDDFVKDSPQLQAMVKADRAMQKQSFWARIRQKVTGSDDAQSGNRLAAIQERNKPRELSGGIDPADLANMSAAEIMANRQNIAQQARNALSQDYSDF